MKGILLASIPLLIPTLNLLKLLFIDHNNPLQIIFTWLQRFTIFFTSIPGGDVSNAKFNNIITKSNEIDMNPPPVSSQLLAYVLVSIFGYWATDRLIPIIKSYTLRKGISGKDLGKRGTVLVDKDV